EELDKCSTCDENAVINNGLSAESLEQLRGKRGEDIVNADVAGQGYEATKAETDRNIEIK
ncbi:MAG: radical SAM protein, partial [Bacteroidales bacterium]|nr:radical SAM protein [Bacteroidales bacterium]